ncbi:hypothetical protein MKW94_026358 [Papaver nudicaule]|uniref:Uncharacterized protein n=1 Tax=Papaver nudicaule TaxID=74823 RepID=A0AA41UWP1_PAPNU|nr:hypothetical protein [Papaver nudicaule]
MARFQSLIIGCVFICTLVVLNTLICTANGKPKIVGSCYTSEACDTLCSGRTDKTGQTSDSTDDEPIDGQCGFDDEAPDGKDPMVCACCVYGSFESNLVISLVPIFPESI